MIGRLSKATLAMLASAIVLNATAAVAADKGDLYFVNVTKRAVSLTLDDQPSVAPFIGEVLGRPTVSGPHILHIAVEGGPNADVPMTFDPDHVAQDENGRSFWCVVAAIDSRQQLRTIPATPSDCSKFVAAGLHPQQAGEVAAGVKGDLYLLNIAGKPLALTVDRDAPAQLADRQVFGSATASGPHDLHLAAGDTQSVDLHLTFSVRNLAHDSRGMGYWCVGVGTRPNGSLMAYQLEAAKCVQMVGMGSPPPAH